MVVCALVCGGDPFFGQTAQTIAAAMPRRANHDLPAMQRAREKIARPMEDDLPLPG
jgi:hypothetical protein